MRFSFDLFCGDESPAADFVEWLPRWWYHASGLPAKTGELPGGDRWILVGWFLGEQEPGEVVRRFFASTDVETLFNTDGQFILVVHTIRDDAVEIFRDRTGLIPLFYSQNAAGIAVSTWPDRVRDLLKGSSVPSKAILENWPLYRLTFAPNTPYNGLSTLAGRDSLHIRGADLSEGQHPMAYPTEAAYPDLESASAGLGECLSLGVKKRLQDSHRIAAWLSGGNDSSLLVALMRKHYAGRIKTVFVTFEGNQRDYREYALHVANKYDTEHSELELSMRQYLNRWAGTIGIIQAPLNHPCTIGQAAGLEMLSGDVDMVYAGEGADTVFGGPYWAPMLALSYAGKVLPRGARRALAEFSKKMTDGGYFAKGASKALRALGTPLEIYLHSEDSFGVKEELDRVFGSNTWERALGMRQQIAQGASIPGLFSFHMLYWIALYVAVEMLLGLRYGVHCVYPFLDCALMYDSLRLPVHLRYHYSAKKAALKRYSLNYFDREFVYKPKEGFGVPLEKWFAKPEFEPFMKLPLEERSLKRGWWNERELKKIIDLHTSGQGTDKSAESIPWITVNLELWARICLEGDPPSKYTVA